MARIGLGDQRHPPSVGRPCRLPASGDIETEPKFPYVQRLIEANRHMNLARVRGTFGRRFDFRGKGRRLRPGSGRTGDGSARFQNIFLRFRIRDDGPLAARRTVIVRFDGPADRLREPLRAFKSSFFRGSVNIPPADLERKPRNRLKLQIPDMERLRRIPPAFRDLREQSVAEQDAVIEQPGVLGHLMRPRHADLRPFSSDIHLDRIRRIPH